MPCTRSIQPGGLQRTLSSPHESCPAAAAAAATHMQQTPMTPTQLCVVGAGLCCYVTLRLRFLRPEPIQLRKMVPLCWSVLMLNCTLRNSRMWRSVRTAYGVNGPSRTCTTTHTYTALQANSAPAGSDNVCANAHNRCWPQSHTSTVTAACCLLDDLLKGTTGQNESDGTRVCHLLHV